MAMGNVMLRRLLLVSALFLATAFIIVGCKRESPPAGGETVQASEAYVENFGQPPTPEKGHCFARVGFFPLQGDSGRVRALPFFLFRDTDQLQMILGRMVDGSLTLPPGSGLFNPFPSGAGIQVQSSKGHTVTLNLTFAGEPGAGLDTRAIAAALTETAAQFEGIEKVVILLKGKPLPGAPAEGFRHDPSRVDPVGPPSLFMVIGSWDKGKTNPGEIVANFDRPVKIESFHLEDGGGREIRGDYSQSIFDMSVVIHPESPAALHEGMTLRARWDVTDNLGRHGRGSGEFILQRYENPSPGPGVQ
jgi:hypothetical protein